MQGERITLKANVFPPYASNPELCWDSNHEGVAKVDCCGTVTGVTKGTATITCRSTDGTHKTASCRITVTGDTMVNSIKVDPPSVTIKYGKSMQLKAIVCPSNAANKNVLWESNTSGLPVNPTSGIITGQGICTATVTAKAKDGSGVQGTCKVTVVTSVPVESVGLNVAASGEESGINPHSGENGAGVVSNINNLLTGHNFESLTAWTSTDSNCDEPRISNYAYEPYTKFGKKLLRMESVGDCTENGVYQLTNSLPAGQYTFSAYLRVLKNFTGTAKPGVYLRVTDTAGNILAESERITKADSEYIRLAAPFELTAAQSVKVQILVDGKGIVYADAAQLENNPFVNPYNMLENGNFEKKTLSWNVSDSTKITDSTAQRFNMSRSLRIMGDMDSRRYAYQKVTVKTNRSTKETFTLSGWAKGYGIVDRERNTASNSTFRLRAVVKYPLHGRMAACFRAVLQEPVPHDSGYHGLLRLRLQLRHGLL